MKKTKFTEAQIVFTLRQADTGVTVVEDRLYCLEGLNLRSKRPRPTG